jgi:stage IV sporulation protein FB
VLVNVQPTQFDLNFRIFGIPVRVHPSYWLVSAIFAWPYMHWGVQFVLVMIACMFVSLMAHELGHALMYGAYRIQSGILLYFIGGLTISNGGLSRSSQRIIVTLAGPSTNFLIAFIVWATNDVQPWEPTNDYTRVIYFVLFDLTLYWGLLNLIPVLPLDGGQISRELWLQSQPRAGIVNSLRMSVIVAIAVAVYSLGCAFNVIPESLTQPWLRPGKFVAIFFAVLAVQNYVDLQNMQGPRTRYYDDDDRPPWR